MIYLDNNSTSRLADRSLAAMQPFLSEQFGNPSSLHLMGQAARHGVENARAQIAALIGAQPREIIFTSGGTEADNLAIMGTLEASPAKRHVVTTSVEHTAVLQLCERLAARDYRVTFLPIDSRGRLDADLFENALTDDTALAAVMWVNNETGVIFPIEEIADIAARKGVPLHVDAVQAAGKIPIDVRRTPVATLALSAHKIHGPKGVGALYVAPGARLRGQLAGGHQERDLRPGTENVAGIMGFGAAAELAAGAPAKDGPGVAALRDRLEKGIATRLPAACVIGEASPRVCNTANIAFRGIEAEAVLIGLSQRGLCASSGSACSSGSLEPSHVLRAMGLDSETAKGAIRFSLSRYTTEAEIDQAIEIVASVVAKLAAMRAAI